MEGAAPTWTIRYRNATGKQVYKPLGNLLEILETKRFDYCHGLALKFITRNNKGVSTPFQHRRRRLRRLRGRPPRKEGRRVAHDASRRYARLLLYPPIGRNHGRRLDCARR
jgi:hypothetical protein